MWKESSAAWGVALVVMVCMSIFLDPRLLGPRTVIHPPWRPQWPGAWRNTARLVEWINGLLMEAWNELKPSFQTICELGHFAGGWSHYFYVFLILFSNSGSCPPHPRLSTHTCSHTHACAHIWTHTVVLWLEQERMAESPQRWYIPICLKVEEVRPSLAHEPLFTRTVSNTGLDF